VHFLITNDDGYEAAGLATLVRVARRLGTVDVVAPRTVQSQTSHAISMSRPLAMRLLEHPPLGPVTAVDGRPADCTRLALAGIAVSRRPDWVLSGINHGGNLGVDLHYSGTVAAAREAVLNGVPAIAFSQVIQRPLEIDWEGAAVMAARALERVLEVPPEPRALVNVNLPAVASDFEQVRLVETTIATEPLSLAYETIPVPEDCPPEVAAFAHYRYTGRYRDRPRAPGSDVDVAFAGGISLSRLAVVP
jgi:5'-nucleotidase